MRHKFCDAFVKIIVELIDTVGVLLRDFIGIDQPGTNGRTFEEQGTDTSTNVSILGNNFGYNVPCSCIGLEAGINALFSIQEGVGVLFKDRMRIPNEFGLLEDDIGQWGQSFFTGDAGASFPLGTIRQVEVFHFLQRRCVCNSTRKFRCQLALPIDQSLHIILAIVQSTQC